MAGVTLVEVTAAEAGQKLAQFLARRVGPEVPGGLIMRWIRTGQTRVDGGRSQPFVRLRAGQVVRIPPHGAANPNAPEPPDDLPAPRAEDVPEPAPPGLQPDPGRAAPGPRPPVPRDAPPLAVIHQAGGFLVVDKPPGLPTHGGTGHLDSLAARLAAAFPDAPFAPTPAHRLDKDTSGLLAVALTYTDLIALQEAFKAREVGKFYLAWVAGSWPGPDPVLVEDYLEKRPGPDGEKVRSGAGKPASSRVRRITGRGGFTLVEVELFTGRTHQIRVQLASRGHALAGDRKYGGPPAPGLMLHAWRLVLPGLDLRLLPGWTGAWRVDEVPDQGRMVPAFPGA